MVRVRGARGASCVVRGVWCVVCGVWCLCVVCAPPPKKKHPAEPAQHTLFEARRTGVVVVVG